MAKTIVTKAVSFEDRTKNDPYIQATALFLRSSPKPFLADIRLPRISAAEVGRLLTDPFAGRLITEISNNEDDGKCQIVSLSSQTDRGSGTC